MTALPQPELPPVTGRVKWFDATRGFGFLVCDELEGDVLLHFSVLREHGRRSVPEGAIIEFVPVRLSAGCRPRRCSRSTSARPCRSSRARPCPASERADRKALADAAGEFEPVEVKWFNRVRGYGFLKRPDEVGRRGRVRAHGNGAPGAARRASAGTALQARIAPSGKGLTAVELRDAATRRTSRRVPRCSSRAARRRRRRTPAMSDAKQAPDGLREMPLTIRSGNGEHRFTVEVAATPEQQERGLMFRKRWRPTAA